MNPVLKTACETFEAKMANAFEDFVKSGADGGGWSGWDTAKTMANPMSYITGGGKAKKDPYNAKAPAAAPVAERPATEPKGQKDLEGTGEEG
jgi:hypothetical protein